MAVTPISSQNNQNVAPAIQQLINANQPGSTQGGANSSTAASNPSSVSQFQFLQLLTAQLQNQDPLHPMDDTQSIAELAQFSALQSQTNLATAFQTFQTNFSVMQSAGLIGKTVQVVSTDSSGNSSTQTGTVQAVQIVNGQPSVTLVDSNGNPITDQNGNPLTFPTTSITGIK
ncbi:MAG TPA: flagellar hook capping FlgD N-terminal domain-containing protein [Candidatus Binatia bacterium]|nr:flagellar hook capping FlgD N-terminal domain-containing protein [Candidatus Binatia bacterium]